jgi:hypothetical protein
MHGQTSPVSQSKVASSPTFHLDCMNFLPSEVQDPVPAGYVIRVGFSNMEETKGKNND